MGKALYRKYRSRSLDEIVGQDHVTNLLKRAIEQDKIAHAYLFTGPRGTGKTSIARIVAHAINELPYSDDTTHLDIIEIDAASNNGVEDIRDLRDRVQIAPVNARRKVYIIDEVHMLSKAAFNALLKTLEEPPEHVVFILATTDLDKVPATILSRTQRHTFRRATEADIINNLKRIAEAEAIEVDDDALRLLAIHADGSFRDSVSMFDQLRSGNEVVDVTAVTTSLGLANSDQIDELLAATIRGDISAINDMLQVLESAGIPARTTARQLTQTIRYKLSENSQLLTIMNGLVEVSRSSSPEIKLLTTLGLFAPSKPVTASDIPEQAPAKQATDTPHTPKPADPKPPKVPTHDNPETEKAEIASAPKKTEPIQPNEAPFDWSGFLTHIKVNHVALHSVLNRCQAALQGDVLIIYTGSVFFKNKLDSPKYKQLLNESLNELGYSYEIDTVSSRKPLGDSQAERIAAMMGGGEEVSYE